MYGSESGNGLWAWWPSPRLPCAAPARLMRSLTCRDGAVSGVVVEPVEVFAALGAEVKRACNREKRQAVRAGRAMALGVGEGLGTGHGTHL